MARDGTRRGGAAWWPVLAATVATVLVVGGVLVLTAGKDTAASRAADPSVDLSGAVPWTDAPAPSYRPPPTSPAPAPATGARPCTAGDVAASFAEGDDGAGGHLAATVRFRNTGRSTCVLKGYPAQVVVSEPGQPDVRGADGSFFPTDGSADMPPGHETLLILETDSYCPARESGGPAGPAYHHVEITLPGGGTVAVDRRSRGLDVTCGLGVTRFFVPEPTPPEPHDPLGDLRASLVLPRTVAAGTTLTYVVTLENPTGRAVALDRCPGYLEVLFDESVLVKSSYALSCGPVGSVAAHDSVRFEMRLRVPARAPAGRYGVQWMLLGPVQVGAAAKAGIEVTAAAGG